MAYQEILFQKQGNLAIVTINRPEAMNAFTGLTTQELTDAVGASARDTEVRSVILTGAGDRAFSAGADVGHLQRLSRGEDSLAREALEPEGSGDDFCRKLYYLEKPTFAAVNGVVAGGSFGFLLACDIRIASDKARFTTVFIKRSITPHYGCTWHLPRLLGQSRALELLYSGDMLNAEEALKLGLVSHVVPHDKLMSFTIDYASRIGKGSPVAMALTKREIRRAFSNTLEAQMDYELSCNHVCHQTGDFKEAVAALGEKREPVFKGR